MTCQTLNAPPAGVTAYLVAGSTTTMLAEGLPEGARLEFAASADGPVLLSLEGVERDGATAFELSARQVDDLIARTARYIRIVTGDGDTLHVLAAGRVWERSGWSGECGRTQVVTRLVAGPPGPKGEKGDKGDKGADSTVPGPVTDLVIGSVSEGPASATITGDAPSKQLNLTLPKGDTGADGRGVESITDDDADGIATVLYTDGAEGALPLPRGPQGDPAPMPEIAWAGDVLTVDGVSSPPLSGPAGPAPATSWSGTSLIVGDNPPVNLQGPVGERGPVGSPGAVATASDYLLVGPGRPDTPATTGGIITGSEPVGCEYRSTDGAGVGAWTWTKRPTGWVVTDGDTGLRSLKPALTNVEFTSEAWDWTLIREGDTVTMNATFRVAEANTVVGATQGIDTGFTIPVGFRIKTAVYHQLTSGALATYGRLFNQPGLKLRIGASKAGDTLTLLTSWVTANPWPTTLPGTPA